MDVRRHLFVGVTVRSVLPVVKYLEGRNHSGNDPDEDANAESDCEEGSPVIEDELPKAGESKEDKARAVLTTGSFSAYVHF